MFCMYVCMYVCVQLHAQVFNYTSILYTFCTVPIHTSHPKCYEVFFCTLTMCSYFIKSIFLYDKCTY